IVDFAILHGTIECESDGFGERAAGTDEGLRDAAVAAPVPIWVCERRVSAYRTDLTLGNGDVGAMPRQKPPAEMDLARVVAADRAAVSMRPGVGEPALRIIRVARRAILHLLDRGLELREPCRILGEA